MVLIPKKKNPSSFSEFWPISLCNFFNKIFTRILCDWLSVLLPNLILDEQTAFLKGRDIADNILLAQELVQSLPHKTRSHNVAFKFDMAKAFDRVSWHFLSRLLSKFGFDPHLFIWSLTICPPVGFLFCLMAARRVFSSPLEA